MADFVLVDGDLAMFLPTFGAALVVVQPGTLAGSGPSTYGGKPVCVEGDESSVEVPGCMYISGAHVIPGTGTLKISGLASDQVASHTQSGDTPVMLKGGQFEAKFEVQSPAMQPTGGGPVPDSTTEYSGQGSFVTTNTSYQAT